MARGKDKPAVDPGNIIVIGMALLIVGLPVVLLVRTCSSYLN